MKAYEMIKVRSSTAGVEQIMERLADRIPDFVECSDMSGSLILLHCEYKSDLTAVIVWDKDGTPEKSREGLSLAAFFALYGSVEHSIWSPAIEIFPKAGHLNLSPNLVKIIP